MLASPEKTYAQFQLLETKAKVDTMSFGERFSFHTNAVDWICQMPNARLEFDLGRTNYSKWSFLAGGRFSLPVWTKINPYYVWDNKEVHLELRNYSRYSRSIKSAAFYWGLRAAVGTYDIKINTYGNRGKFAFGGISLGMIRHLYGYPSGNSLDLEFGTTIGAVYSNNTKYYRDNNGNYKDYGVTARRLVRRPIVNEVLVGLVYRFGNFPLSRKYHSRYNTDVKFRNTFDDYVGSLRRQLVDKHISDSLFNMSYGYFSQQYDSIYKANYAKEKNLKRLDKDVPKAEVKSKKSSVNDTNSKQSDAMSSEMQSKQDKQQKESKNKKETSDKKNKPTIGQAKQQTQNDEIARLHYVASVK